MLISKDIKFDCAHMLSNYEGKCANLHGHTYHGTVELLGKKDPSSGMVLDYNTIKEIVDVLDHAIIFSNAEYRNSAEEELLEWARAHNMRHVVLSEGKSTAESIAHYLAYKFLEFPNVDRVHIKLSETDGSWIDTTKFHWR